MTPRLPRRLGIALAALLLGSCATELTEIVVFVTTDISVPDTMDRVRITIRDASNSEIISETQSVSSAANFPLTLGLQASDSSTMTQAVRVEVVGLLDSAPVATREAQLAFVRGESRLLGMPLERRCVDFDCPSGQTCARGVCSPTALSDSSTPPFLGDLPNDVDCLVGAEVCNEQDDDCDGEADESLSGTTLTQCGACGLNCTALPNVLDSQCANECIIERCQDGFEDCNSDPTDGCEVNLESDPENCGGCGNLCSARNAASVMCAARTCQLDTCEPLFGDCDMDGTNGCETELTENGNCGQCGRTCPSGECTDGFCAGERPVAVAAGGSHSCVAIADGRVFCWGRNRERQLGTGDTNPHLTPELARGIGGGVLVSTTSNAAGLFVGLNHGCALLDGGEFRCWGENTGGQCGVEASASVRVHSVVVDSESFEEVEDVALGSAHTCIRFDSAGYCFGDDSLGQLLGAGAGGSRPTPTSIEGLRSAGYSTTCTASGCSDIEGSVEGLSDLAIGSGFVCGLTTRGVECLGEGRQGQLGRGSFDSSAGIAPVMGIATRPSQLVAGSQHACALDGTDIYCWGSNEHGQLGSGAIGEDANTARLVDDGPYLQVSAGAAHTCAVRVDGRVQCWGHNNQGQLGDGTTADRERPTFVQGIP